MRKAVLVQLVTGTVLLSFLGTEHPSWAVEKNISDCVTDGSCGKKGVETPNLPDVSKILASNEDGKINLNGCSGMMGSKAEKDFLSRLDTINEKFWNGEITSDEWKKESTESRVKFNPGANPDLDKLLAVGISGVAKQYIQAHVATAAMDAINGHPISAARKQKLMDASKLTSDQIDAAIQAVGAPFRGYAKTLNSAGLTYDSKSHSWDLSKAQFNVNDLQSLDKATLRSALGLFISPNAMNSISDQNRQLPVPFPGPNGQKLVILPPQKFTHPSQDQSKPHDGNIRIVTEDQYRADMAKTLSDYKEARTTFLLSSKKSTTMWDQLKKVAINGGPGWNACWGEHCLQPFKSLTKETSAEIDKNSAYQKLVQAQQQMVNLGVPKQQLQALQTDMSNVIKADGANIESLTTKLDAAMKASTMAEETLAAYALTAGLGELASGSKMASSMDNVAMLARLARNSSAGFAAMAKFPMMLSGATILYDSAVDTKKFGGGFMCNLAENLTEQGPAAVKSAIMFGGMGALGGVVAEGATIVKAAQGMEASKAVEAGAQFGQQIQKVIGVGFTAQQIQGAGVSAVHCAVAVSENMHNQDQDTKAITSADAWKTCGQVPLDVGFAAVAGYHSVSDGVAGYKSGEGGWDSVKQTGKALVLGAPEAQGVTDVSAINLKKPEQVTASIKTIMSKPGATIETDLEPVAQRLAHESKPADLVNLLKDPDGRVSLTAQMALGARDDAASAKLLIAMAERPSPLSLSTNMNRSVVGKALDAVASKSFLESDKARIASIDDNASIARTIIEHRATQGDPTSQQYLVKIASSHDPMISDPAMKAAKSMQNSDSFTELLKNGLAKKDTQLASADILSSYDTEKANRAVSLLIHEGQKSGNPQVLDTVMKNLQARSDSQAGVLLQEAQNSDSSLMRALAKNAIHERQKTLFADASPSPSTDLSLAERTEFNKFQIKDAKARAKSDTFTVGDVLRDKTSGASYTLVTGGYDQHGHYFVAHTEDGEPVWFTDADLKRGKNYVKVEKTPVADRAVAEAKTQVKSGEVADSDGDPETAQEMKKSSNFREKVGKLTDGLKAITDKLSRNGKINFEEENNVMLERVVKDLKPRDIDSLFERLKNDPKGTEDLIAKAFSDCGGKAVSQADWDLEGNFKGVLYAFNENSCAF